MKFYLNSAILCASALLAGCSPSKNDPRTEAEAPAQAPKPLTRDFLGISLGKALEATPCGDDAFSARQKSPCKDVLGKIVIPPDRVPSGVDYSLDVTTEDGEVSQIRATVPAGHSGLIAGNLVEKYGPAHSAERGDLQWTDAYMAVLYWPATTSQDGAILVSTRAALQAAETRQQQAQNRSL